MTHHSRLTAVLPLAPWVPPNTVVAALRHQRPVGPWPVLRPLRPHHAWGIRGAQNSAAVGGVVHCYGWYLYVGIIVQWVCESHLRQSPVTAHCWLAARHCVRCMIVKQLTYVTGRASVAQSPLYLLGY